MPGNLGYQKWQKTKLLNCWMVKNVIKLQILYDFYFNIKYLKLNFQPNHSILANIAFL